MAIDTPSASARRGVECVEGSFEVFLAAMSALLGQGDVRSTHGCFALIGQVAVIRAAVMISPEAPPGEVPMCKVGWPNPRANSAAARFKLGNSSAATASA
jgi:hypothetical protein